MRPKEIRQLAQEYTVRKRQRYGQSRESEQDSEQEIGIRLTDGSKSRFNILALWLWANHCTSLSFRFFICKIDIMIVVCTVLVFVMLIVNSVYKVHSIVLDAG